jgi:LDH2 family malate/lactate/ureidoglycolate dehydrogenase
MPTIDSVQLDLLTRAMLEKSGTPTETAKFLSGTLIAANLAGHDSHGVLRMRLYIESVRDGRVIPDADAVVTKRDRATAIVDARFGWAQPAMWLAAQTAVELAREHGLGAAVLHNAFHIGRCAIYVEEIARQGMIGLLIANAGPAVAPYGGTTRVMGTNPIAWAMPRADGKPPIALDVATAGLAEGKLQVARSKSLPIPEGILLNAAGEPTTDPADFYTGGTLLPFGGHKGGGFSIFAQLIGRALAGLDPAGPRGQRGVNGPMVLAIDIAPFVALNEFFERVEAQAEEILASPPAPGFAAVQLPGDPELEAARIRGAEGIPLPQPIWDDLADLARSLGLDDEIVAIERTFQETTAHVA